MTAADDICPTCGTPVLADDRFCEACGATLAADGARPPATTPAAGHHLVAPLPTTAPTVPPPTNQPCVGCGAPPETIGADRYCQQCGLRQPDPRDHTEVDLGVAAGVSDRGHHHHRNEDAMRVEAVGAGSVVAVVCDGVSSSIQPEIASQVAALTAGEALTRAVTARPERLAEALVDAVAAAQEAVTAIPWKPDGSLAAPSCTFVGATVHHGTVTVGWVGDSRAYWLGDGDTRRLTEDDSWAGEQVTAGLLTEEQAEADSRAHAITRWLGADAPAGDPQIASFTPASPGRLVVCSDGLWNYLTGPEQLADLVAAVPAAATGPPASPLAAAQALTNFALASGGHDNVTVVVIEVAALAEGRPTPREGSEGAT
jgi:serine/threonine protein phosphatase PrpC